MNHEATYQNIKDSVHEYMILDKNDDHIIDLLLATALSIELDKPVWLMITAPPSSGKTELLNILSKLDNFHILLTLTSRFLFSGHPTAQGGYMIREVKDLGIIAFPDFTTVLSMNSKSRNEIFNQFRVMYDQKAGLGTGIDSGKFKPWEGKVAIISLVTEAIEKIKEKESDLGERFLYYNYNPRDLTNDEIQGFTPNESSRLNVPKKVKEYLSTVRDRISKVNLSKEDMNFIITLAKFISIGRALVLRTGYSREIDNVTSPEKPHRLTQALKNLFVSLLAINNDLERTKFILRRIALSSIPKVRLVILLEWEKSSNELVTLDYFQTKIYKYSDTKVRRTVEDMVAQKILYSMVLSSKDNTLYYKFSDKFLELWKVVINK